MVSEYVAQYGGTASGVNADVAEAYSVGQVVAAGDHRGRQRRQRQDHHLPAQRRHAAATVQGTVKFDSLGENANADAFIFQWQNNGTKFVQVLPAGSPGSVPILATKPAWAS